MNLLPPISTPLISAGMWSPGTQLWVKDESRCPTGTFKDRLAWEYVAAVQKKAVPFGPHTILASITLGNTMRSFAYAIRAGLPIEFRPQLAAVFPCGFSERTIGPATDGLTCRGQTVLDDLEASGVRCITHLLQAGYVDDEVFKRIVNHSGDASLNVFNATNGIGLPAYKKIIAEALDDMPRAPDHIILPVGAGVLFMECVELVMERGLNCRVTGVAVTEAESIADKIYGVYSPFYQELRDKGVALYNNDERFKVIRIDDGQIMAVRQRGLPPGFERAEPSAWAGLVPLADGRISGGIVLIVNTGCGILPRRKGVDLVLNVLKSAQSNRIAAGFYANDPIGAGRSVPLSLAEAIGQLSRLYLDAANKEGLIEGVALSRVLLIYDVDAGYKRTYDRISKINGFGDIEAASEALRSILAYIKVSEALSGIAEFQPAVQLTSKLFDPATKDVPFLPNHDEKVYVFYPAGVQNLNVSGIEIHGWLPEHSSYKGPAVLLIERLIEVMKRHAVEFSGGMYDTDDREIYNEPILEESKLVIERWLENEGAEFRAARDPRILMLAAMEVLGKDWAFVAVRLPLGRLQSFYKSAGLWCIIRLPMGTDLGALSHRDQLYTLNFIGRALMAEVQGYAYRLASWQRRTLAENQDSYERLAGTEFLPRVLGQDPESAKILIPVAGGLDNGIPLTDFLPQIPFGQASDKVIVEKLKGFLNVQKVGYMSRQKQLIEGILHDLQPRRMDQACATQEEFNEECEAISRRARSLGIDCLDLDQPASKSLAARKEQLRSAKEKLERLRNTREYLSEVIGRDLEKRKSKPKVK